MTALLALLLAAGAALWGAMREGWIGWMPRPTTTRITTAAAAFTRADMRKIVSMGHHRLGRIVKVESATSVRVKRLPAHARRRFVRLRRACAAALDSFESLWYGLKEWFPILLPSAVFVVLVARL